MFECIQIDHNRACDFCRDTRALFRLTGKDAYGDAFHGEHACQSCADGMRNEFLETPESLELGCLCNLEHNGELDPQCKIHGSHPVEMVETIWGVVPVGGEG